MMTQTETTGTTTRSRPGQRTTTLLDLLFDLLVEENGEQALVHAAVEQIVTRRVVLCGSYRGVEPVMFQ